MIDHGLIGVLGDVGWRWKQLPPLVTDPKFGIDINRNFEDINCKNCLQVGKVSELIKEHVLPECESDNFPLILGGDHCISIGTISAIKQARKDTAIVWVGYSYTIA